MLLWILEFEFFGGIFEILQCSDLLIITTSFGGTKLHLKIIVAMVCNLKKYLKGDWGL